MRLALWILSACAVLTACAGPEPVDTAVRERASIRLALAQAYHEEGQHSVALEEVERSLVIDATAAPAHVLHGVVLMALSQPERARTSLDRALALDGRLVSAWHNRAWLSCQEGQWVAAQADFAQALVWASGAERAQALMVDGVCAARAQAWERAEQRLSQALEVEPQNPVARYHWAHVQQSRGQWAQAQWALQSLNTSPHANAQSLWLAILGAQQLGDTVAVAQWGQALGQRYPQSPQWDAYQRKFVHDR
jgi:type IV pilus assembly protein PilF